ncbi:hypothetical protein GCM10023175_29660 [Pseudonocardia xishanensis]|uniref:Uncharacterized protein n=1 Tax=Pseudonocardia xishanensis TaxID=630995 RepID=A0ABP8RS08_9PSEU
MVGDVRAAPQPEGEQRPLLVAALVRAHRETQVEPPPLRSGRARAAFGEPATTPSPLGCRGLTGHREISIIMSGSGGSFG